MLLYVISIILSVNQKNRFIGHLTTAFKNPSCPIHHMPVVLDIETRELIPENGDLTSLRIALAGLLVEGKIIFYTEETVTDLFVVLDSADIIVGHNLFGFDYRILQRYASFSVSERYAKKTCDLLKVIMDATDRRVSLNDLAMRNLNEEKSGNGADAPALFASGNIGALKSYLSTDLLLTGKLFSHILKTGKIRYGHKIYKEILEREIAFSLSQTARFL